MAASANDVVLTASGLGKTYAQPVLGEVSLEPARRRSAGPDRRERRGQEYAVQAH